MAGVVIERPIPWGAIMTRKTHGDPFNLSVERVARTLLEFAREEPALVGRRGPLPVSPTHPTAAGHTSSDAIVAGRA